MAHRERQFFPRSRLTAVLAILVAVVAGDVATAQVPTARHVVIVGVDGLSPDGIRKAPTPNLHRLMKSGASTLHARAVMPTVRSNQSNQEHANRQQSR